MYYGSSLTDKRSMIDSGYPESIWQIENKSMDDFPFFGSDFESIALVLATWFMWRKLLENPITCLFLQHKEQFHSSR